MGNSAKKGQSNVVHIEFLTAVQKQRKDKAIAQNRQHFQTLSQELDLEIVQNYQQFYQVDYRKTLYLQEATIRYKDIVDMITTPNVKTPSHLLSICSFYTTKVKSCDIYFNNQPFSKDSQTFQFSYDPLYVEVIYQPKHWMERLAGTLKDIGQKTSRFLYYVSKLAYVGIPFYTAISTLQPFVVPTLATAQLALHSVNHPKAKQASSVATVLLNLINRAVAVSQPFMSVIQQYVPGARRYALMLGLFAGRTTILSALKISATIFFPYLTPLLMLLG